MTPPLAAPVAERPPSDVADRAQTTGPFVVNLCSSTTPMALTQPADPELKRFKFFVSRRLEDGRERFRLHMGYFETLKEAEEWVGVAREFYPGAWAGEAPGKRLGARPQPPEAAAPARVVATAQPSSAPPAVPAGLPSAEVAAPRRNGPPVGEIPVLRAAAPEPPPAQAAPTAAANGTYTVTLELVEDAPAAKSSARASGASNAPAAPSAPAAAAPVVPIRPKATPPRAKTAAPTRGAAGRSGSAKPAAPAGRSNVREVLASLDGTQATREMPRLVARAAEPQPQSQKTLSDTQVLRILEDRRDDGTVAERDSSIALLKPDDTGTRRALKDAVAANRPVSFAVQLDWSVQPIDVAKVPPLAIFSAYTLYTVEGSREGRRWYGLRLGFFSDAISAKQVAHYVRSDFNAVAVVPVSTQERTRATGGEASARATATPRAVVRDKLPEPTSEFKLIDDDAPAAPPVKSARPKAAKPVTSSASRGAAKTSGGQVRARERRSPQTLEETLEILGADELEIDRRSDRKVMSGARAANARAAKPQPRRDSPFTKLLGKLSEKSRKAR